MSEACVDPGILFVVQTLKRGHTQPLQLLQLSIRPFWLRISSCEWLITKVVYMSCVWKELLSGTK